MVLGTLQLDLTRWQQSWSPRVSRQRQPGRGCWCIDDLVAQLLCELDIANLTLLEFSG